MNKMFLVDSNARANELAEISKQNVYSPLSLNQKILNPNELLRILGNVSKRENGVILTKADIDELDSYLIEPKVHIVIEQEQVPEPIKEPKDWDDEKRNECIVILNKVIGTDIKKLQKMTNDQLNNAMINIFNSK